MGAIAEAIMKYAQPLIDKTDGSTERLQHALSISQFCWNLAMTPEERQDEFLAKMQPIFKMDDDEFEAFKRTVVTPMLKRHQEMFPEMNRLGPMTPARIVPRDEIPPPAPRRLVKKYAGTGRNSLCPCGSGKKYKLCCGR